MLHFVFSGVMYASSNILKEKQGAQYSDFEAIDLSNDALSNMKRPYLVILMLFVFIIISLYFYQLIAANLTAIALDKWNAQYKERFKK